MVNFANVVGEEDVVGAANVRLVVIDEAARVSVGVYRAVVPMLALSNGRMVCLSTPFGKRGFFYEAWVKGGSDWERIEVPGNARCRSDEGAGISWRWSVGSRMGVGRRDSLGMCS
jgi:hypothetical protein